MDQEPNIPGRLRQGRPAAPRNTRGLASPSLCRSGPAAGELAGQLIFDFVEGPFRHIVMTFRRVTSFTTTRDDDWGFSLKASL